MVISSSTPELLWKQHIYFHGPHYILRRYNINDFYSLLHKSSITADVQEIGTIIRSLGCFPSEAELPEIIAELEEDEPNGFVRFEKFLPAMTKILLEHKFHLITEDLLLQAFEVRSAEKGHLEPKELTKCFTQEGELFTQEEMEEMLSADIDPEKNVIFYKDFVSMMTFDDML
ncbi:dynein regulatory complex protein 8-like [Xyrauchen texanus]|uniref:dynein regulatory complex protein 8-like n=1 Tax=Xyrauchen texanus TaxID=154827 RepID=UPI0022429C5A|nr:dynein regulatory complex protein 8-like [Xyrauchen texanus]